MSDFLNIGCDSYWIWTLPVKEPYDLNQGNLLKGIDKKKTDFQGLHPLFSKTQTQTQNGSKMQKEIINKVIRTAINTPL